MRLRLQLRRVRSGYLQLEGDGEAGVQASQKECLAGKGGAGPCNRSGPSLPPSLRGQSYAKLSMWALLVPFSLGWS